MSREHSQDDECVERALRSHCRGQQALNLTRLVFAMLRHTVAWSRDKHTKFRIGISNQELRVAHSIQYESSTRVLTVKGTGVWNREAFKNALSEALPIAKQYGCSRALLDLREVTPAFTFPDVFAVMRSVSGEGEKLGVDARHLRRACVLGSEHHLRGAAIINYAVSLMTAFGQPVAFFEDNVQAAISWLSE